MTLIRSKMHKSNDSDILESRDVSEILASTAG